jgi:hypothetical protein
MNIPIRSRWNRIFGAAFGVALTLLPTSVFAWGDGGHEITGVIAYARLAPGVKKNVDALLAADRDTLTAADFVSRTVWADKYRDSDRQTTKKRYEGTREWHFVDIELSDGNAESACHRYPNLSSGHFASAGPAKACVIDKVSQFAAELRNDATPKSERILALKFLLHFIGDLHQPLHAADNRDRGGNDVAILYGNRSTPDNLHSYWDRELIERLGSDPRKIGAALNRQISPAKAESWSRGAPGAWAKESFGQAKSVTYNLTGARELNAERSGKIVRLDAGYEQRALPVVREQLSKAGVRLAAVLNNVLR